MRIGNRDFNTDEETYIMGILNVTPDSFSDGGKYTKLDQALYHTEEMLNQGADLIDVGGESTRPGFSQVSVEEEIERVIPVIEGIRERFDTVISVDTYKAATAKAAMNAGADMINDVWGFRKDPQMADVAASTGAVCCLMHNRDKEPYVHLMEDILVDLGSSIETALKAGVKKERIMVDPGIGFAKNQEENLKVLQQVGELKKLGYPILLAASNKSVIGNALNLPKEERGEGTLAITAWGLMAGCSFIRVHDVRSNKRLIQMLKAIQEVDR